MAHDLARWSRENAERLCGAEGRYGGIPGPGAQPGDIHAGTLTALADSPAPPDADEGTLLLHGLRHLHLRAAENSLYWQTLAQAGQALRDRRLLNLTSECHPRSLRQMRWTTTMIKKLAPQLLTVPAEPS
ncbi:hypothetical protein [Streptomyces sp. NPDC059943]|uniref:hypothetical protein n=1 Tax=Streptomyces sp. NPDC059943 TaxID=3347010 RepID=UPI003651A162